MLTAICFASDTNKILDTWQGTPIKMARWCFLSAAVVVEIQLGTLMVLIHLTK